MHGVQLLACVALVGIGATAVMDAWLVLLSRLGVPTGSFAMVGRWVGRMSRGRFRPVVMSKAPPVRHELALGWLTHYGIGIVFAAFLVALQGPAWIERPTFLPALAVGMATVAAPWFLMQPAMGLGFLASKTPSPLKSGLRSLANHAVFGVGLYVAAAARTAL